MSENAAFSLEEANPLSQLTDLLPSMPVGAGLLGVGGLAGIFLFVAVLRKLATFVLVAVAIVLVGIIGRGAVTPPDPSPPPAFDLEHPAPEAPPQQS